VQEQKRSGQSPPHPRKVWGGGRVAGGGKHFLKAIPGKCRKYKYGVCVFKNAFPVYLRRKAVYTKRHASRVITAGFL
jgi:hypothetical protein